MNNMSIYILSRCAYNTVTRASQLPPRAIKRDLKEDNNTEREDGAKQMVCAEGGRSDAQSAHSCTHCSRTSSLSSATTGAIVTVRKDLAVRIRARAAEARSVHEMSSTW